VHRVADGRRQALVGGGVGEVAADVGQRAAKRSKTGAVELLAGPFDAFAGVLAQALDRPVVAATPTIGQSSRPRRSSR
jgi:hypothetical protein